MKKTKRLFTIDIMKYICACMVVFLHVVNVKEVDGFEELVKNIFFNITIFFRPVEFFFISASFLLFKKNPDKNIIKKYIKRIIILYAFYSIFYINEITANFSGRNFLYNIASLINQFCITGYSLFSWYIPSLIVGIIFVFLIKKYIKKDFVRWTYVIIVTLVTLIGTSYKNVLPREIHSVIGYFPTNLIRSVIYIFLGELVCKEYASNKIGNFKNNTILWVIFFCLQIIEMKLLRVSINADNFSITIFKIFGTYYMLKSLISLNQLNQLNVIRDVSVLGKASIIIYFLHIFVYKILKEYNLNVYLMWVTIIMILTSVTFVIEKLSKKDKFEMLKYIM